MGLSAAMVSALSGLRATQAAVDLVAQNVANAETAGYTKKSIQRETIVVNGLSIGVRATEVTRAIDALLLAQTRDEQGERARLDVIANALGQLDAVFGVPGGADSLDGAISAFVSALQDLSDAPEQQSLRSIVLSEAQALVAKINDLSQAVQGLRQQAETGLGDAVSRADALMKDIAEINGRIGREQVGGGGIVDLLDQRDRLLGELSLYMDINVQETDSGAVRVFTQAGHLLVDGSESMSLVFNQNSSVGPSSLYSTDPSQRTVGTLFRDNGSGQLLDLFADGGVSGGIIGGYRELRDDLLVDAQAQLDELAHALSLSLSQTDVSSTAATVGAQSGFDLDIGAAQPGDVITLNYTQTPPGTAREISIIRVDDPASLPLDNSATPNPNDTVIGVDFSGGPAAVAAALNSALGPSIAFSNPSGNTLRVLDDGAANTIAIDGLSATVTATGTSGQGLGLPLFVDGPSGGVYSGSLDGAGQKLGFASRISVNPQVLADDTALVVYETSPATPLGDQSRPHDMLRRLTEATFTFSPQAGIGGSSSPVVDTIGGYAQRIITTQTGKAASAEAQLEAQSAVTRSFEERIQRSSGVDVDQELAELITLQNAYAANARVISVVQDLFDALSRI